MTATNGPGGTSDDASFTLDALGRFATRSVAGSLESTYGYLGDGETVVALVGATTRVSAIGPDGSRVATKDGSTSGGMSDEAASASMRCSLQPPIANISIFGRVDVAADRSSE